MKNKAIISALLLAACGGGAYYHGTVVPYSNYNEAKYTSTSKSLSQKWALEDAQLYCNGGQKIEGQPNRPFKVVEQVTTDYAGLLGEQTDKAVSTAATAGAVGLLAAGAIKKDKKLALAGVGTAVAGSAVKGEYTTTIKFVCK